MLVPLDATQPTRRSEILAKAGQLFGSRGYDRTSMRDIAAAVGILPGSVYHHFPSKAALLAAIYADVIDQAVARVHEAMVGKADPWDRLEAAAAAHLQLLLTSGTLAAVVADPPSQQGEGRKELVRQRDRYEDVFRGLIAQAPLPPGVTPSAFRHALLGALNWALTWYRPGGDPPEVVARSLFAVFRASQAGTATLPHQN